MEAGATMAIARGTGPSVGPADRGETERTALLREIETLQRHLEARRASGRPLRASLVGAYREALQRCYERLDGRPRVHEASNLDPFSGRTLKR